MEKRRLTQDEWAKARARWQGFAADGYDWLVREIGAAFGVLMTRQGLRKAAITQGWAKDGTTSEPIPGAEKASAPQPQRPGPKPKQAAPAAAPPAVIPAYRSGRTVNNATDLTAKHEEFARALAEGLSQPEAYRRAFPSSLGWKTSSVDVEACKLAGMPNVRQRLQDLLAQAAAANGADIELVLAGYLKRLKADPRELTEIRVNPCRYCWGAGHLYQYTDGELRQAELKHEAKRETALAQATPRDIGDFDPQGGGGYSVLKGPYDECPSCGGAGVPQVVLKDSRNYTEGAALLFGGVKKGKDGIEVKIADRSDALAQVARHVGFYEADKDPVTNVTINLGELDELYERLRRQAAEREQSARGRAKRLGDMTDVEDIESTDGTD